MDKVNFNYEEDWDNFKSFLRVLKKVKINKKKDLLKMDTKFIIKYNMYRTYFHIDKRLKPKNVYKELRKFKKYNLYMVADYFNLKNKNLLKYTKNKYDIGRGEIANILKDLIRDNVELCLKSVKSEYRKISIAYKVWVNRKVYIFYQCNCDDYDWIDHIENYNLNVNLQGFNYNKSPQDFVMDYHNQSNDFAKKVEPILESKQCDMVLFYNR